AALPVVAMVGARNASAAGQRIAERLARALGEAGFTVVSGLARGIDAAAHRGALASGTIAVLAGGIDQPYPPQNRALFDAIAADGLALAENPPGFQARAQDFPRRNRIVAGLAAGVVVIEAAARSGSLITARLAAEEGRQVFAVPGSPLDPRNAGAHELIRNGATLVTGADDIAEALADSVAPLPSARPAPRRPIRPVTPAPAPAVRPAEKEREAEGDLLSALGPVPVTVDELARRCHLSSGAVAAMLLDLELAGRIERHPGQRVSLISR
ncbi:MAG: DNA-protecting protein DprA, partial [Alphaproteobacteria bacterium]|nr:DNA-protecting protein DprA [Alphaproteobacteria bacterium]